MRAARGSSARSLSLAAIRGATWIGTMGAYFPVPGADPVLVGVYVSPDFRGSAAGVTDALLDGVEAWVREQGHTALTLEVHEKNPRARAYYDRRGFTLTGRTLPYPLDPSGRELELEMRKTLS
jgi:GNAT superfamily N-acetyltransferase